MDQNLLKTSTKQRVIIAVIAVAMLVSIIASYAAIILANGNVSASTSSEGLISKYESAYNEVKEKVTAASVDNFNEFIKYKNRITAYNEASANSNGVQTTDLKVGNGRTLADGDTNYLAYYVGWCADETVFDSSFDNIQNPTALSGILNASMGLIEGRNIGVVGMKLGGIREITIPGELAYGESTEICGGYNKPLKFMVMAVENSGTLGDLATELSEAQMGLQYAYYGIDYNDVKTGE